MNIDIKELEKEDERIRQETLIDMNKMAIILLDKHGNETDGPWVVYELAQFKPRNAPKTHRESDLICNTYKDFAHRIRYDKTIIGRDESKNPIEVPTAQWWRNHKKCRKYNTYHEARKDWTWNKDIGDGPWDLISQNHHSNDEPH